ncbi:MAG: alanine racemase [Deltaproteobacteria bacterium]|jgi:predicted amino acid racemase|nr:alanine racemase [Deltaproteobacteria bacterium]
MPRLIIDTKALAQNGGHLQKWAKAIGLEVLPVLKVISGFRPAVEALADQGFTRFGLARPSEDPAGLIARESKTLIQLTPISKARETISNFGRSFQSSPEVLDALNQLALASKLPHEIILMVNLGDSREGIELRDAPEILDYIKKLTHLSFSGFGAILTCLSDNLPDKSLFEDLRQLIDLAASRGLSSPVISLGGTVMCDFVAKEGRGPITELRLGDPLLIGVDVYRHAVLPDGPWRQDVLRIEAEVVEKTLRKNPLNNSLELRALLDVGRFHLGPVHLNFSGYPPLDGVECLLPGAVIAGATAGYLVVDLTSCLKTPQIGDMISLRPGYWAIAHSIRHPDIEVRVSTAKDFEANDFISSTDLPSHEIRPVLP